MDGFDPVLDLPDVMVRGFSKLLVYPMLFRYQQQRSKYLLESFLAEKFIRIAPRSLAVSAISDAINANLDKYLGLTR